jgi:hypothetical protein
MLYPVLEDPGDTMITSLIFSLEASVVLPILASSVQQLVQTAVLIKASSK